MSASIRPEWLLNVLPDPVVERLLRAALVVGDEAPRAWDRWNAEVGLDRLDEATFRLLPLVYHNLTRQGFHFPQKNTLKGIYRQAWCKNQVLFHRIAAVLRELTAAGIPTMVLKGAALSRLYYRDDGLRPMRDVDVMVPADRAQDTIDLLDAAGWLRLTWSPRRLTDSYSRYRHSIGFRRGENDEFDLHWRPIFRLRDAAAERAFWSDAVPLEIHGMKTVALDATGQLLHACLHGMEQNIVTPVRWVADSVTILRGPDPIRWDAVVEVARRNRMELFLKPALEYLARSFDAPVPADVLRKLTPAVVNRWDVAEFRRVICTEDAQGAFDTFLAMYRSHWRGVRDLAPARRLLAFPSYLQYHWRLDTPWSLGTKVAHWAWRRVAGDLRGSGL